MTFILASDLDRNVKIATDSCSPHSWWFETDRAGFQQQIQQLELAQNSDQSSGRKSLVAELDREMNFRNWVVFLDVWQENATASLVGESGSAKGQLSTARTLLLQYNGDEQSSATALDLLHPLSRICEIITRVAFRRQPQNELGWCRHLVVLALHLGYGS